MNDNLKKRARVSELYDFYGGLLTERQQAVFAYYYFDDFSMGEIAEDLGISRAAVHDSLKRTEESLENYEAVLCNAENEKQLKKKLLLLTEKLSGLDIPDRKMAGEITDIVKSIGKL